MLSISVFILPFLNSILYQQAGLFTYVFPQIWNHSVPFFQEEISSHLLRWGTIVLQNNPHKDT